ncbi:amidase signature domain-containing protein [Trichoderma austrokoningii]
MSPVISLLAKPRQRGAQKHALLYFICGNPGLVNFYVTFLECLRGMLDAADEGSGGTVYDIYGRNLQGFSDDDHKPFDGGGSRPWDLEGQIEGIYEDVAARRAGEEGSRPYDFVVLMGHSVGAYISVEIMHRHMKQQQQQQDSRAPHLHLRHGFLLFPTLTHIASSPSGRRVGLLTRLPGLEANAHRLAKLVLACIPYACVLWIVANVMGFTRQTAEVTARWLKSRDGVWQAVHLGVSEMGTICEERWEEELWAATERSAGDEEGLSKVPRFFIFYGRNDHWVANHLRDAFIERRREGEGHTRILVDEGDIPHAFCLVEGLESKHFTSVQLTKAYLARIEQVNETVHAVVETNPDALSIAKALDDERASGTVRGPLHGIPVLVKNNIATQDKMGTTAGSYLLVGATVPRDAFVVQKLRHAGAIILGKANMSEWANFRARDFNINGWSAKGGQTLAAYHASQDASGSSSGSGVAADLGLAWAALGTETDGSIICPAQRSSVVGVKPTVGLTSRDMVIPVSEHQDTVGPMARTVKDAAYLLQVIAGEDANDKYTAGIPRIPDYVAACRDTLKGARIGVPWKAINEGLEKKPHYASEVEGFRQTLPILEAAGAILVEADFASATKDIRDLEMPLMGADFRANLASYLSGLVTNPSNVHTLEDVRSQTQKHPLESFPERDTGMWDRVLDEQKWDNASPEYKDMYDRLQQLGGPGGLPALLDEQELVAVAMPSIMAPMWTAVVGCPGITVPMGHLGETEPVHEANGLVETAPGVPYGISFLGRRWAEEQLLGLAYGFEQRTRVRERDVKRVVVPTAGIA